MRESRGVEGVCVLGAGGFLGSHLIQALLEQTRLPLEAVDTTFRKLEVTSPRLRRTQASIRNPGLLERIAQENGVIVSTTALCNPSWYNTRPVAVIEANFTELIPLVRLCTSKRRFLIHFSTCEVYGLGVADPLGGTLPMNEDDSPFVLGPILNERWTYACAKQLLERLIWAHVRHHGLKATVVRPFNVIGPRMDFLPGVDGEGIPRVLPCFVHALLKREPLKLVDGGRRKRTFVSVHEFTEAVVRMITRPTVSQGQIFNVGNPANNVTIAELAGQLTAIYRELTGTKAKALLQEVSAMEFYGPGYEDTDERIPDIGKARRLLDWQPTVTLAQMLPIVLGDYLKRYGSPRGMP